jgi:hypothetical protein
MRSTKVGWNIVNLMGIVHCTVRLPNKNYQPDADFSELGATFTETILKIRDDCIALLSQERYNNPLHMSFEQDNQLLIVISAVFPFLGGEHPICGKF